MPRICQQLSTALSTRPKRLEELLPMLPSLQANETKQADECSPFDSAWPRILLGSQRTCRDRIWNGLDRPSICSMLALVSLLKNGEQSACNQEQRHNREVKILTTPM